jgi:hypothetical protein
MYSRLWPKHKKATLANQIIDSYECQYIFITTNYSALLVHTHIRVVEGRLFQWSCSESRAGHLTLGHRFLNSVVEWIEIGVIYLTQQHSFEAVYRVIYFVLFSDVKNTIITACIICQAFPRLKPLVAIFYFEKTKVN